MSRFNDLAVFHNCFNRVKYPNLINDNSYEHNDIAMAIYRVAGMATHNSVTKDGLCTAIRWLYETYRLEEENNDN